MDKQQIIMDLSMDKAVSMEEKRGRPPTAAVSSDCKLRPQAATASNGHRPST